MLDLTRRSNREASSGRGTLIALELSGRASQDATSAILVGDLAIIDAKSSTRLVGTEAVLSIAELTKRATLDAITRDIDTEAT